MVKLTNLRGVLDFHDMEMKQDPEAHIALFPIERSKGAIRVYRSLKMVNVRAIASKLGVLMDWAWTM